MACRQRRPARPNTEPMAERVSWVEEVQQFWSSSFDQFDGVLEELRLAKRKGTGNEWFADLCAGASI